MYSAMPYKKTEKEVCYGLSDMSTEFMLGQNNKRSQLFCKEASL